MSGGTQLLPGSAAGQRERDARAKNDDCLRDGRGESVVDEPGGSGVGVARDGAGDYAPEPRASDGKSDECSQGPGNGVRVHLVGLLNGALEGGHSGSPNR